MDNSIELSTTDQDANTNEAPELRERWNSRVLFWLAAIGSAVGLGNLWRFPYLVYKFGGGAFLLPYTLCLIVIGVPLLWLELSLGQIFQKGAVGAIKSVHRRAGGVGLVSIFGSCTIVSYYSVVLAWSVMYFGESFSSKLPWNDDPEAHFNEDILQIADSISDSSGTVSGWLVLCLFIVWVAIYFSIWKGVKSTGNVVMITAPLPLILLIILFFRGITLPGAGTGIKYFLEPDFSLLASSELWLAAVSQIFFSFGLGYGIMQAYASYNSKTQDLIVDGLVIAVADSLFSFLCGFVVFSILGYMAQETNRSVAEVATSGAGLAFVVFPEALSLMPFSNFFAVLFFLMLFTLGIDSAFSIVEAVATVADDLIASNHRLANSIFGKKQVVTAILCTIGFLVGILYTSDIGFYLLDIVDHYVTSYVLILAAVGECLVVGWTKTSVQVPITETIEGGSQINTVVPQTQMFTVEQIRTTLNSFAKYKLGVWWTWSIKLAIPLCLGILVMKAIVDDFTTTYGGYSFGFVFFFGWTILFTALGLLAFCAFYKIKPQEEAQFVPLQELR